MPNPDIKPEDAKSAINPEWNTHKNEEEPDKDNPDLNKLENNPDDTSKSQLAKDDIMNLENEPREVRDSYGNPVGWKNRVSKRGRGKFKGAKKKGPIALIISLVTVTGSVLTMLFSPGMLIVQIKEAMTNKFNSQLTSMEIRTNKKVRLKIKNTITDGCVIKVLCKYKTMSARQIRLFDKAGIKISGDDSIIPGRTKPTSFNFNGKDITPDEFSSMMKKSPEFRAALKKAYSPKFAGFADKFMRKAGSVLGITKAKIDIDGDTDDLKLKDIQNKTKNGIDLDAKAKPQAGDFVVDEDGNKVQTGVDSDGNPIYKQYDDVDIKNMDDISGDINDPNAGKQMDNAVNKMDEVTDSADNIAKEIGGGAAKTVGGVMKVTGWMDNLCTIYATVRAVGFAAKTVRALQLARYAILFLNIADQIKAGDSPDPEDVEYLGDILTKEVIKSATAAAVRSATDSFGYKYAAYNDRGIMGNFAMEFLAGGGLTGSLIHITSKIGDALGGSPKDTCKTLANPWVSAGSAIVGIALMFVPGANVAISASAVISAVGSVALVAANIFLPALLQDIVAGKLIDDDTFGEKAGEAITSGSSGIMSTVAKLGGNSPLKVDEAVQYKKLTMEVNEQYAEEDRVAHSMFDISNKNTFFGSIFYNLTPSLVKMSSLSGIISSIASISTNSLSSTILQSKVFAYSEEDIKNELTMCDDEDYQGIGLATDPYCNVMYGIPVGALDADPIDVANAVLTDIDTETGEIKPGSNYDNFRIACIERANPLGFQGNDFSGTTGEECLFGAKFNNVDNSNYYIHYIDQRIENGMSGDDEQLNAATDFGNDNISFYDPTYSIDNIASSDLSSSDINNIIDNNIKIVNVETNDTIITEAVNNFDTCKVGDINNQIINSGYLCDYSNFGLVNKKRQAI